MGIDFFSRLGPVCFSEPTAFPLHRRLLPGPGIYAILVSDSGFTPRRFRPIYFGETEDFSQRVTTSHERYSNWTREAGPAELHVAQSWMYGSTKQNRAALEQALRDCYRPACNSTGYSLSSTLAENLLRSGVRQPPTSLHNLITGLMSPPLSLFISHAWEYDEEYYQLEELLNGDAFFDWRNLSVPEHEAVEASSRLPKSYLDLIRVLEDRISKSDCVLVLSGMYCAQRVDTNRDPVGERTPKTGNRNQTSGTGKSASANSSCRC